VVVLVVLVVLRVLVIIMELLLSVLCFSMAGPTS
jgi:hypothetical protein